MSYSVDTSNIFDVLNGDPPAVKADKKVAPKPAVPAPVKAAAPAKSAPKGDEAKSARGGSERGRGGAGRGRGGARGGRGGPRGPRDGAVVPVEGAANDGFEVKQPRKSAYRGGDAGAGPRGNKRQFDRRSGTGRPRGPSKGGAGSKGTWGRPGDELNADLKASDADAEEVVDAQAPEGAEAKDAKPKAEGDAAVEDKKEPIPEEPKTFSLDEYEANRKAKLIAGPAAVKRTVKADFPDAVKVSKSDDIAETDLLAPTKKEKKEKKAASKEATKKATKAVSVDAVFKVSVNDPVPEVYVGSSRDREDGDRAPRRGGRNERGRGAGRGRGANSPARGGTSGQSFSLDTTAFPGLPGGK